MTQEIDQLDKIDLLRERTGVSFNDARELLENTNWDVLQALAIIQQEEDLFHDDSSKGVQIMDSVKALIRKGNTTKLLVKSADDESVAELPLSAGIVGAVMAPKLILLGAAACLVAGCSVRFKKHID